MTRHEEREKLRAMKAAVRFDYLMNLHFGTTTVQADEVNCPDCSSQLHILEQMAAWYQVGDLGWQLWRCPDCLAEFRPYEGHRIYLNDLVFKFMTPEEVLCALRNELGKQNGKVLPRELICLTIIYFGTMEKACDLAGIKYIVRPQLPWQLRGRDFLGLMPDTHIAQYAGATEWDVYRFRRARGIGRYNPRKLQEQYQVE